MSVFQIKTDCSALYHLSFTILHAGVQSHSPITYGPHYVYTHTYTRTRRAGKVLLDGTPMWDRKKCNVCFWKWYLYDVNLCLWKQSAIPVLHRQVLQNREVFKHCSFREIDTHTHTQWWSNQQSKLENSTLILWNQHQQCHMPFYKGGMKERWKEKRAQGLGGGWESGKEVNPKQLFGFQNTKSHRTRMRVKEECVCDGDRQCVWEIQWHKEFNLNLSQLNHSPSPSITHSRYLPLQPMSP